MRDSKQLFVTNAITREGIAEELNLTLECIFDKPTDHIATDDDRLTDEICRQYAADIGNIPEDLSVANCEREEEENNAAIKALKAMGINTENDD